MKKAVVIILCVVLALALAGGGVFWAGWNQAGRAEPPEMQLALLGQRINAYAWEWQAPVLGGLTTRRLARSRSIGAPILGEWREDELPAGEGAWPPQVADNILVAELTVEKDGQPVYTGPADGLATPAPEGPGEYALQAVLEMPPFESSGYGLLHFKARYTVLPAEEAEPEPEGEPEPAAPPVPQAPTLDTGTATLQQGDVFSMQLRGIAEGVVPTGSSQLGPVWFTPMGDGRWTAAVPVGNTRAPGVYTVRVAAGGESFTASVTVEAFPFDVQEMEIDLTDPVISEANSPAAIQEYNNVILAARAQADTQRYWQGTFLQPAEGRISTHFGQIRYTNKDYDHPSIHWGMDIANAEGTPILAPEAGRVYFADYLLAVGYTIIIEYGGGLKSYMFHMNALHVEEGQMVEKGQHIGDMGTTGYSTGNHLHFEVRIGGQAISPEMLFNEDAGLYSVEKLFE